jgi:hypothetical protein
MKQKILYLLLSAVLAFGAWTYVVTVVSPESEDTFYNIPVVLINEQVLIDKGLMVVSESNPTMTLRLRGNRSDLNGLKNSDITIIADLSKINAAGEQNLSCDISFTGASNAFEILDQKPTQITLQIAEWATKEIPVNVEYTGMLGPDYIAYKDEVELDRESVTITGPKNVVDQIAQARINVDLNNRVESISESYRYTLCDDKGNPVDASSIKTNAAEIRMTLRILRVKEIQLKVDVIYGGGATQENTTIVQDFQTIRVAGSEKLLQNLGDILSIGTINLAELTESTELVFPVELNDGLINLSNIKEVKVQVTVPQRITSTISIPVSDIEIQGLPEGMALEFVTQVVEVTVQGPSNQVLKITAADIRVTIDVTDAVVDKNQPFKAQVKVSGKYVDVDVVGSVTINVDITQLTGGNP